MGIEKYVIAHDCGVVVNPMLVEGQIVGGAAQGIGGALFEEFNYNSDGQLLTGLVHGPHDSDRLRNSKPAGDPPALAVAAQSVGVKGVGEGGPIAPPAVIANAVCDALKSFKVEFNQTPVKPQQIEQAIRSASLAR